MNTRESRAHNQGMARQFERRRVTGAGASREEAGRAGAEGGENEATTLFWDVGAFDVNTFAASDTAEATGEPRLSALVWDASHWDCPDSYWGGLFFDAGLFDTHQWGP